MPTPHDSSRLLSYLARPWVVGLLVVAVVVAVIRLSPDPAPEPPLQLVALGADGAFRDTLDVPASWGDTSGLAAGVRVPLVLGIRNTGEVPGRPDRLSLSLPARYRLTTDRATLEAELGAGSPLVTYTLPTGLTAAVDPGRVPTLLPSADTVWLEVVIPSFHCVALADSVPEFIPASKPPLSTMRDVRIFYSFVGGDLARRRTGTLTVRLDSALLAVRLPDPYPSFPAVHDTALATPAVGPLRYAGSRRVRCGQPQDPMEIRSSLWLTEQGGRVLALHYAGAVRKRLYDLDGDGVVERESWDADADGAFETTREARLPTPGFLLPAPGVRVPGTEDPGR